MSDFAIFKKPRISPRKLCVAQLSCISRLNFFRPSWKTVWETKMTEKRKPGRPSFEIRNGDRATVERLASAGATAVAIAAALGCSIPTLKAKFAGEIANGAARRRAEVIEMIYAAARKGSVSAMKHLDRMMSRAAGQGRTK
jgi:hypothetical protein